MKSVDPSGNLYFQISKEKLLDNYLADLKMIVIRVASRMTSFSLSHLISILKTNM